MTGPSQWRLALTQEMTERWRPRAGREHAKHASPSQGGDALNRRNALLFAVLPAHDRPCDRGTGEEGERLRFRSAIGIIQVRVQADSRQAKRRQRKQQQSSSELLDMHTCPPIYAGSVNR